MQSTTHDHPQLCTLWGIQFHSGQTSVYFSAVSLAISLQTFSHWHALWSIIWKGRGRRRRRRRKWEVEPSTVREIKTGHNNRKGGQREIFIYTVCICLLIARTSSKAIIFHILYVEQCRISVDRFAWNISQLFVTQSRSPQTRSYSHLEVTGFRNLKIFEANRI